MIGLDTARAGVTIARANVKVPERPDRYLRGLFALWSYGVTALGAIAFSVARTPLREAVIDDDGPLTYRELWRSAHALADEFTAKGIGPDTRVGLLADNTRFFVQALLAGELTGANVVLLNTSFARPQLEGVVADERIDALICGAGYDEICRNGAPIVIAEDAAAVVIERAGRAPVTAPKRPGRVTLLTSGTTGRPKGAARQPGGETQGSAAILGRIPFRHGGTRVVAPPLFHGWGLTHLLLGLGMSATVVLHRKFDPQQVLEAVVKHDADTLIVVPVMLQRILALPATLLSSLDTSSLRILACSGSALPAATAREALDRFGPVVYNVYGSTEVATATIATPADLRDDPATAGRPAPGVTVTLYDDRGQPVERGKRGRVFVRGAMQFEGYTTGGGKDVIDGSMSTGDLGVIDRRHRLHVVGREDDMIVSGAENVYPREIEDLLITHPAVAQVAVIGTRHDEFGQVLKAFVVTHPDTSLTTDELKAFVRGQLARHKVPHEIEFCSDLPRNAMGKVLRRRLV